MIFSHTCVIVRCMAKIVAICGPDKVGKATQSRLLAHTLRRYGDRVALVEVPFNDRITYSTIQWMLALGHAKRYPNLFQFIQFINKLIFQLTYLVWLRLAYDFIILDRWRLSAIVYGDATGTNRTVNRALYALLRRPDLVFVIDAPPHKRLRADDSYETDQELQARVRTSYRRWAEEHPGDHVLVDGSGKIDLISDRIQWEFAHRFC